MGKYYTERLRSIEGLILPTPKTDYADNIYWVYGIVLDKGIKADNKEIQKMLAEEGIGTRTFFWCMHEQPVYQKMGLFQNESYPNAEYLARKGFYIPSGLALTKEQMDEVVDKVIKVMNKVM
jgi:perosamine synthetase